MKLEILEKSIGYSFIHKEILEQALTHTSYAYENNVESNEKLEFLGDSILEFVTSKYLYLHYSELREGEMTKVRASVVCEESLHKIAISHNFGDFLFLGKSEIGNGGRQRPAILADSVEAVIAAIYLDSDVKQAENFILTNLEEEIKKATKHVGMKDYKTVLQEKLQNQGNVSISYKIIKETGPDHDKTFTAQVIFNGTILAIGEGSSKKAAEMQAAKVALEKI